MSSYLRIEINVDEYRLLYRLMKESPLKASPEIDRLVPIVSSVNSSAFLVYDYLIKEKVFILTKFGQRCRLYYETPARPDSSGDYMWDQVYYLDIPVVDNRVF